MPLLPLDSLIVFDASTHGLFHYVKTVFKENDVDDDDDDDDNYDDEDALLKN